MESRVGISIAGGFLRYSESPWLLHQAPMQRPDAAGTVFMTPYSHPSDPTPLSTHGPDSTVPAVLCLCRVQIAHIFGILRPHWQAEHAFATGLLTNMASDLVGLAAAAPLPASPADAPTDQQLLSFAGLAHALVAVLQACAPLATTSASLPSSTPVARGGPPGPGRGRSDAGRGGGRGPPNASASLPPQAHSPSASALVTGLVLLLPRILTALAAGHAKFMHLPSAAALTPATLAPPTYAQQVPGSSALTHPRALTTGPPAPSPLQQMPLAPVDSLFSASGPLASALQQPGLVPELCRLALAIVSALEPCINDSAFHVDEVVQKLITPRQLLRPALPVPQAPNSGGVSPAGLDTATSGTDVEAPELVLSSTDAVGGSSMLMLQAASRESEAAAQLFPTLSPPDTNLTASCGLVRPGQQPHLVISTAAPLSPQAPGFTPGLVPGRRQLAAWLHAQAAAMLVGFLVDAEELAPEDVAPLLAAALELHSAMAVLDGPMALRLVQTLLKPGAHLAGVEALRCVLIAMVQDHDDFRLLYVDEQECRLE